MRVGKADADLPTQQRLYRNGVNGLQRLTELFTIVDINAVRLNYQCKAGAEQRVIFELECRIGKILGNDAGKRGDGCLRYSKPL